MLSKVEVLVSLALARLALAAPPYNTYCDSKTLCIDAINPCDVPWGG